MTVISRCATAALLAGGVIACTQAPKTTSIIDDNVAVAKQQLAMLADSSETGGVIRIPSTYKNGRIDYVPTDDWRERLLCRFALVHVRTHGRTRRGPTGHASIPRSLDSIQYLQWHHDVGFMIYDSYGNGLRLKNIPRIQGGDRADGPVAGDAFPRGAGRHPVVGCRPRLAG